MITLLNLNLTPLLVNRNDSLLVRLGRVNRFRRAIFYIVHSKKAHFIGLFVFIWTLSSFYLVEAAGVEPASASLLLSVLHA